MKSDRLSSLPSDLTTHIISFLPTTDAIKLCVLSRQWRYPCSSSPELEFDMFKPEALDGMHKQKFKNCLDKTLAHHRAHIKRFGLSVSLDDEHITISTIEDWITEVLQHHVTNLVLHVRSNKPLTLPSSLFVCSTLRELTLEEIQLTITSNLRFPVLRELVLYSVEFCDEDDNIGNRIFSPTIFPLLQSLEIDFCDQISSLSSSIPSLVHLHLCQNFRRPKVHLSIPTLEQFEYFGFPKFLNAIEFSADTISSLRSVELFTLDDRSVRGRGNVSNILCGMRKVETLQVCDFFVDCLSWDQSFTWAMRNMSFNVKQFSLGMQRTKSHVQVVKVLAGNFPLLQTLYIHMWPEHRYPEDMVVAQEIEKDDTMMLPHLRQVKIRDFKGSDSEVEFVSYLFSRANILEEMRVICHKENDSGDPMAIHDRLKSLARVSQKLTVICS